MEGSYAWRAISGLARSFGLLRASMPFALRASIAVQFVPDKLDAQDDKKTVRFIFGFAQDDKQQSDLSSTALRITEINNILSF